MTTRAELERQYTVVNGRITSPGKFEGERLYVPYFWDIYLNGGSQLDDDEAVTFEVELDDIEQFPELANRPLVRLRELDNGFVVEE